MHLAHKVRDLEALLAAGAKAIEPAAQPIDEDIPSLSRGTTDGPGLTGVKLDAVVKWITTWLNNTIAVERVDDFADLPTEIQDYARSKDSDGSDVQGIFHRAPSISFARTLA